MTLRGQQVVVATDIGVFISKAGKACDSSCTYQVLGNGLPAAPIFTVRFSGGDPNLLIAAAYGRGVWSYRFGPTPKASTAGTETLPTPKFLGKLLASFDFELDEQGWTTKSNTSLEGWRRAAPGSNSSQSFQVLGYTDEATASMRSPRIKVPARSLIKVQWDERRDTEPCCDYLNLDWSCDGYVWHSVRSIDGQNPDWPLFTTVSTQFVAPAGSIYLRFRLTSDQLVSSPVYTGVAVDNVIVKR